MKYCQERHVPLVLAWLPHKASLYRALFYKDPYTEKFFKEKFLQSGEQPFVHPLYINSLPEDPVYFSDFRHLSAYGCIKTSEWLADSLAKPGSSQLVRRGGAFGFSVH